MPPPPRSGSNVEPGDLRALVTRLRRWMSDRDSDAYLIEGSFAHFGTDVENLAATARPAVQAAADAVFQLVVAIEKTPEYKQIRERT